MKKKCDNEKIFRTMHKLCSVLLVKASACYTFKQNTTKMHTTDPVELTYDLFSGLPSADHYVNALSWSLTWLTDDCGKIGS